MRYESQVITLLIAMSEPRKKHDEDTPKDGSEYNERVMPLPILTSGEE